MEYFNVIKVGTLCNNFFFDSCISYKRKTHRPNWRYYSTRKTTNLLSGKSLLNCKPLYQVRVY